MNGGWPQDPDAGDPNADHLMRQRGLSQYLWRGSSIASCWALAFVTAVSSNTGKSAIGGLIIGLG